MRPLAVVAAGTGLVLGVTYLPGPINLASGNRPGPAAKAQAELVTQTRVICPGPEALGINGLPDSLAQTVSVSAVSAPAASLPSGFPALPGAGSLAISGLPSGGEWAGPVMVRGQVAFGQISAPRSALITGSGTIAPGTVATQRSWTRAGNNRSLVTAACTPAATSLWLIAGGAEPGRRERLVLTNPGPNPVTVDISVLGVKGPIQSQNGRGLVIGGYARTVILLDAIAGSERSPVVHVAAQGGEIAAVLSDTWLDGVVPRGGDDAVPVAAPALEQVIASAPVQGRAILRVAVTGNREAVVQLRTLTPRGPKALPAGGVTRVAGRSTKDIDLGGLAPGAYAVQVRSDVPVVAAAMVERRRAANAPSDLAWSVASSPISTLGGMALPGSDVKGLNARLDLAAAQEPASVLVTTVGAGGRISTKEIAIAADSVSTVPLDAATSVWVTPRSGLVRAAVFTSVNDIGGVLLSLTPLVDLALTTTPWLLREQQQGP